VQRRRAPGLDSADQEVEELGAVHRQLQHPPRLGDRHRQNLCASVVAAEREPVLAALARNLPSLLQQAELFDQPGPVGSDGDTGPDLLVLRRLLVHVYPDVVRGAVVVDGEGREEPANAPANHGDSEHGAELGE